MSLKQESPAFRYGECQKLIVVCANAVLWSTISGRPESNEYTYGDIFDSYEDCVETHPDDDVLYGFYLEPEKEIDIDVPDWFYTVEEAVEWASSH